MNKPAMNQPVQPLRLDDNGQPRFQKNSVVRYLLDEGIFDLNFLLPIDFPVEDKEQFLQLIGYSLCGFGEYDFVTDETYRRAASQELPAHEKTRREGGSSRVAPE